MSRTLFVEVQMFSITMLEVLACATLLDINIILIFACSIIFIYVRAFLEIFSIVIVIAYPCKISVWKNEYV